MGDPEAYGRALTGQLFADPQASAAWRDARRFAEGAGAGLRVQICLDGDSPLHGLCWETLRDPIDNLPLAISERTPLSRTVASGTLAAADLPQRAALRSVLAIASPHDLGQYQLAPIDVVAEVERAEAILASTQITLLSSHPRASGRATLPTLDAALRAGAHLLYLVCHGGSHDDMYHLWLEGEEGQGRAG